MPLDAFFLPIDAPSLTTLDAGDGGHATVPLLAPADIHAICGRLDDAGAPLRAMNSRRVIGAIDAAAARLVEPGSVALLVPALAGFTGYSPAMAERVLRRMAQDWTADALYQLLGAELGGAAAVDGFVPRAPGIRSRAVGAPLAFHVMAGNVPGVAVTSIIRSLLVRSPVLAKSAAAEPVLAPAFARALAAVDAELAAAVAVTWWAGGDEELEAAALRHAEVVVHYGGPDAIRSLRRRAPDTARFIDHGPRVSLALAGPGALHPDALQQAARDVALAVATFDQQGCVSPQLLYVMGAPDAARQLAAAVARGLDDVAHQLPRGRIGPGEAAAIREVRSSAEFRAIAGADVELWSGDDLAWTVIFDSDPAFGGSCLNRTLIVKAVPDVTALAALVEPARHVLQTVGVTGFGDGDELEAVAVQLAAMGATRVTPISAMPWPPAAWHHDGRGPLSELVRWVDLEA
jgi:hypothetical protein